MLLNQCLDSAIGAYRWATAAQRRRDLEVRCQTRSAPVMTLFYHRVADSDPNPWTIRRGRFQRQIEWIRQRYEIVSLVEAQTRLGTVGNAHPAVCLTFDDGYAENCDWAIPWLLDQRIPLTYFVSTMHVLQRRPFPHDVQRGRPLPANTPQQIAALAAAGVEVGVHTRAHCDLGKVVDSQVLEEQIVDAKADLEALTGRAARYFAFPYGLHANLSAAAFRVAFRAGYWGVCSAYGGYNLPGDDPFHIQRFHGDPGWGRFCNWLTFDPRKQRGIRRFEPGDYRSAF